MHYTDPNLLMFGALGVLFLIIKLTSPRKCYATLLEKSIIHERGGEHPQTRFICVFYLDTGPILAREVDVSFYNHVGVGQTGVVYHLGKTITAMWFQGRS